MTIFSYVFKTFEQGAVTGVPRFDFMLRRVFPEMVSITTIPHIDVTCVGDETERHIPRLFPGDVVITDNHLSLDVPESVRTIVVHHGCALTHFDRDKAWQISSTFAMTDAQLKMFTVPNRRYVAPSLWVSEAFRKQTGLGNAYQPAIIPHWVEPIASLLKSGKPKIIGDWRDNNKGVNVWRKLAAACPQWEFAPLNFRDDAGRRKQYGEASLYLCLSLSEGGSYSMCDAEAAELPIVTTDVGNYREFTDCEVINWQDRDNLDLVIAAIKKKLRVGRQKPSFYQDRTFDKWAEAWRAVLRCSGSTTR